MYNDILEQRYDEPLGRSNPQRSFVTLSLIVVDDISRNNTQQHGGPYCWKEKQFCLKL